MKTMGSLVLMGWAITGVACGLKDTPKRGELQGRPAMREGPAVCRVEVKDCVVTEKSLKLTFSVTNASPNDIWVCEDVCTAEWYGAGKNEVTRIVDGTLWIKRRFNLESELLIEGCVFARYRRLSPGQSSCDTIIHSLPIRDASPVENFRIVYGRATPVDIHRVVFEVGYFTKDVARQFTRNADPALASTTESSLEMKDTADPNTRDWSVLVDYVCRKPGARAPNEEERARLEAYARRTSMPPRPVTGDPNAVDIPHDWIDLDREESVRVTVDKVSVPCMAIVRNAKEPQNQGQGKVEREEAGSHCE